MNGKSVTPKSSFRKTRLRRKVIYSFMLLLAFSAISLGSLHFLVWSGRFGKLPDVASLKGIQNHNSSEIYAASGELLGKFYIYDRSSIGLPEISPDVINALIATEDARFYQHQGTDWRSMGRVLVKNLLLGDRSAGGGSTINRQLAKNLFPRQQKGIKGLVIEKIKEGIIARRLEKAYTKDEILTLYLNTVPFGENVFGISAASQRFFNKHPRMLAPHEAACLVGMLKATTSYNPRLNPERALLRRNIVLGQMQKYDYLPKALVDSLSRLPLDLDYSPLTHIHGPAPYFREMLRVSLGRWLEDYNRQHQTHYNLYTDGLKIFTTLDFHLQLMAEQAVREEMARLQNALDNHYRNAKPQGVQTLINREMHRSSRYLSLMKSGMKEADIRKEFSTPRTMKVFSWEGEKEVEMSPLDSIFRSQTILHCGILSLEPSTGHIKVWVGGNHFRYFQFDNVTARRQAGSSFKPLVYAAALESGISPCEFVSNEAFTLEDYNNWGPSNHDHHYEGYYSMKGAMAQSVNTVSTRYFLRTGFEEVLQLARAAGIRSALPAVPSLGLGSGEVSMLELAAAYGMFANQGIPVEPVFLQRIEDSGGRVLYQAADAVPREPVILQETSHIMTELLRGVVNQGTAASLRSVYGLGYDIAGKTGTTTSNADGWFIGYTPGLVTAVWTGLENPVFADSYPPPFGASRTAVPLWGSFMSRAGQNAKTRSYTRGSFPTLSPELEDLLHCPHYLEELYQPSFLEKLLGIPGKQSESQQVTPRGNQPQQQRRGRLRRWIEEIF